MSTSEFIAIIFCVVVFVVVYFLPTIIATNKHKKNAMAIFAINFFFGWSGLGWFGAFVWALTND